MCVKCFFFSLNLDSPSIGYHSSASSSISACSLHLSPIVFEASCFHFLLQISCPWFLWTHCALSVHFNACSSPCLFICPSQFNFLFRICTSCCKMQVGLLRDISANHGLGRAMALLQLLLPPVDEDHLLDDHHNSRYHLHHHLDVGQVLTTRLSTC